MNTTTTPHRAVRRILAASIGLTLATGLLAACTTGGDHPTPSPTTTKSSPTPTETETTPADPVEAAKQANIDAAKARYVEFVATTNTIDQAGGINGYEQVQDFLGTPEMMTERQSFYSQFAEKGLKQTGETKVASLTVTEYIGDPTVAGQTQQVRIDVCLDNGGVDVVRPDGTSALLPGYPTRLIQNVFMQTQQDGRWTINENTNTEVEC